VVGAAGVRGPAEGGGVTAGVTEEGAFTAGEDGGAAGVGGPLEIFEDGPSVPPPLAPGPLEILEPGLPGTGPEDVGADAGAEADLGAPPPRLGRLGMPPGNIPPPPGIPPPPPPPLFSFVRIGLLRSFVCAFFKPFFLKPSIEFNKAPRPAGGLPAGGGAGGGGGPGGGGAGGGGGLLIWCQVYWNDKFWNSAKRITTA
jgi:hypothetical protein